MHRPSSTASLHRSTDRLLWPLLAHCTSHTGLGTDHTSANRTPASYTSANRTLVDHRFANRKLDCYKLIDHRLAGRLVVDRMLAGRLVVGFELFLVFSTSLLQVVRRFVWV